MSKKIMLFLTVTTLMISCKKPQKENKLESMNWLIGTWENKSDEGNMIETWSKTNDSLYVGGSYFIKEKDTLHSESIELTQKANTILYIPTVKGQNNNQPVPFQLTKQTPKQLVFENPKHDFPQKIIYNQITADSLVATISGMQQGKASSESFSMRKK
ncbi:DUF6265 family protein [Flavobacterium sp.]|uniref:DUF6265 family protein n=1 Tax=Flavobacterium sp. TaxID=239 RepID=UPI00286C1ACE|nr:DUF6265 family protein [Flavobacterium sp.]